jgi:hypothetical protein
MPTEDLEKLLVGLPVRGLSPAAESEVLSAILAARPPVRHWWQRAVPLWQAAAACLLLASVTGLLGRAVWLAPKPSGNSAATVSSRRTAPVTIIVEPATPLFARSEKAYVTDIRRWTVLAASTQGESR